MYLQENRNDDNNNNDNKNDKFNNNKFENYDFNKNENNNNDSYDFTFFLSPNFDVQLLFFFLHFFCKAFFCLPPPLYVLAWLRSVGLTGAAPVRVQFEAQGAPYLKEYPQGVHQEVNFNQFFKI